MAEARGWEIIGGFSPGIALILLFTFTLYFLLFADRDVWVAQIL